MINASGAKGITLKDITIEGGNTGISLNGVDGAVLDNVRFKNVQNPLEISNSTNIEIKNSDVGKPLPSLPKTEKTSKTSYYLPLSRGPLKGSQSRYIPAICSSNSCQHAYLSGIKLQASTRIAIKRNQAGYCPLCGADGYTLDGVYNQVAEQFTAMLYDGITKSQLEDMQNILGLAIENGDYAKARADLEGAHKNWKNIFGLLENEQAVPAVLFYVAMLGVMLQLHDSVKPYLIGDDKEAQDIVIIQECINCVVSDDLDQLRIDLLGSKQPPKSEKSSKE